MSTTVEQLKADFEAFLAEDAKFTAGNGAAGTRARKALQEVAKRILFLLDQDLTTEQFHQGFDGILSNSDPHHPWCTS